MSTSSSTSWTPPSGRHKVGVGSSLRRAIKARAANSKTNTTATATPTKRNNLPDRDFYSFRYNFIPESVDLTKPGSIEVKKRAEDTRVIVEHLGAQPGEKHLFGGSEQQAKKYDCVLIYDEETGTFTLEKLDSYMTLQYERKVIDPNVPRPSPPSLPAPSSSKQGPRDLDFEAQLERDLLDLADDDEPAMPFDTTSLRQEEEESDGDDSMIIAAPPTRPTATKAKPARPAKTTKPPSKPPPAPTPQPQPQPTKQKAPITAKSKSKPKEKLKRTVLEVEAEDLEFGQPARQAKRIQLSPVSPALALPGSSAVAHPPHSAYPSPLPSTHRPGIPEPQVISDSEDEWDEVQPTVADGDGVVGAEVSDSMNADDGEDEDEEEIDMNAFEEEMNQQLHGGVEHVSALPIMSLNQFAGGGAEASQDDEDDYTSSEESDDD